MENKDISINHPGIRGDIKIVVEKVHVEGNGAIILTGPSSCGKGEIAKSLSKFLSIPENKHLSMGDILRKTIDRTKKDKEFKEILGEKYGINHKISIFDMDENKHEIVSKAEYYRKEIISFLDIKGDFISQLNWLEFCVSKGLLVPDEWTEKIINATFENSPELQSGIFILDGYPRTTVAAERLLATFKKLNIPVIKVLHLSITKEQMKIRALGRKRNDDTDDSLERRYQFYVDKVQPCIDYLKKCLGFSTVALIDAHRPVYCSSGELNVDASIHEVVVEVMQALGLPGFLLDIK